MRRWIASGGGHGIYWCLYQGGVGDRVCVGSVCKMVTRWRGYIHAQYSPDGRRTVAAPARSRIQDSARAAARWVAERLDERARKGAA
ncbi:MAG: hypothetical protein RL685_5152 [Pseudomonadota bacterium]